jgi:hypothetical protein
MNRRSIVVVAIVVVVAAAAWLGGNALWHAVLVMHGQG